MSWPSVGKNTTDKNCTVCYTFGIVDMRIGRRRLRDLEPHWIVRALPLCDETGKVMPQYRCYFVQRDGHPAAWRAFQSESDGEAHDHALGLLVGYPHAEMVEVWEETRLIFNFSRPAMQTPAELRRLCYLALAAAAKETDLKIKQSIASCAARLAQEAEALDRPAN